MRYLWLLILSVFGVGAQSGSLAVPQSLTLREAVELAVTASPSIQLANLRTLETNVAAGIVASAYKPQLTAHVFAASETNNLSVIGLNIPGFTDRLGPYRVFDARPVLTQTLLDLSLRSRMAAARERANQSGWDAQTVREQVQTTVLELYLLTFEAESRMHAAQARLETADALLNQSAQLASSGEGSNLDLARSRMQREAEQVTVITARSDTETLRSALLEAIGLPPEASVKLAPPVEPNLVAPAAATPRQDIQALEASIRVAKLEKDAAYRERLPKLSASASYGVLGAGPDRALSTFVVSATLSVPIFTGGRIAGEIKLAGLRVEQLQQELMRLKLAAAQERVRSSIELEAGREAAQAAGASAAAAKTSLDLVRLRFGAGMATNVDVVTAQSRLAESQELEIRSRYKAMLAKARLARAKGNLMAYFD